MGNPQVNALNTGVKSSNSHVSGRFNSGGSVNVDNNYVNHPSTLNSKVNTKNKEVESHENNDYTNDDPISKMSNNKFFSQNSQENVVNNNINYINEMENEKSKYMNDPKVKANLEKKDGNEVIDIKTLMVLALIVLAFIFALPFLYDFLNTI